MKKKRVFALLCAILCFCSFCYVYVSRIQQMLTHASSRILYPFLAFHQQVEACRMHWHQKTALYTTATKSLDLLTQEYAQLHAENVQLKAILSYNEDTKELMRFKERFNHGDDIIAQVIARYITTEEHYILINAGSSCQIAKDMVVLSHNDVVGRVIAVYPWYAKVQLITDPHSHIGCYMVSSQALGIHAGTGLPRETAVEQVSHLHDIIEGDDIFTSGEGLIFPQGYRLGTVISKKTHELYYKIQAQPAIDPYALRYCVVHRRNQ